MLFTRELSRMAGRGDVKTIAFRFLGGFGCMPWERRGWVLERFAESLEFRFRLKGNLLDMR